MQRLDVKSPGTAPCRCGVYLLERWSEEEYDLAMKFCRRSRFVTAVVMLFSLLFMQLAVASYSCPAAGNLAMSGANCAGMDQDQPSLCKAKAVDQAAKQSLDKPDAPPVLPFIPVELAGQVALTAWTAVTADWMAAPPDWSRCVAPPIAIAYCCFRN